MDIDDANERPTLPAPLPAIGPFDPETELFFSATTTLPGAARVTLADRDDVSEWWAEQRRRTLLGWVAATMALCAVVLAASFLAASV
jgi:hypothetical protein